MQLDYDHDDATPPKPFLFLALHMRPPKLQPTITKSFEAREAPTILQNPQLSKLPKTQSPPIAKLHHNKNHY